VFRSILVPVDGSEQAGRALAEAVDLARASGAALTLMTSVPDLSPWVVGSAGYGGVDIGELTREAEQRHRELLDETAGKAGGLEQPPQTLLAHGAPGPAIVDQIEAGGHDLVVMGSRGRGNIGSLVLGSVSHHVLQAGKAAVLVVR
jgi:nucleotide-binding universal stress UspA family protein